MNHYTLWHALIGGILIGLASLLATVLSGKIPGISGVFGRLLVAATPDKTWRAVFLFGLIGGAALSFALWQSAALFRPMRPLVVMAIAGLLVGFGTRLGGGCTSGHGVCGVGMGAKDSIAATLIFMVTAMMIVFIYSSIIEWTYEGRENDPLFCGGRPFRDGASCFGNDRPGAGNRISQCLWRMGPGAAFCHGWRG